MGKHHKISAFERDKIAWWLACGMPIREMARQLHRSHSSILSEIKRNKIDGIYGSIKAHKAADARKRNCHKKYLLRNHHALAAHVCEKLKIGWSPEQISGRLRKEIVDGKRHAKDFINHESIYQYIYDKEQKELRLWEKLPRNHKKRYRWLGRRSWSEKSLIEYPFVTGLTPSITGRSLGTGKAIQLSVININPASIRR
jgi:IS30 family transposase